MDEHDLIINGLSLLIVLTAKDILENNDDDMDCRKYFRKRSCKKETRILKKKIIMKM